MYTVSNNLKDKVLIYEGDNPQGRSVKAETLRDFTLGIDNMNLEPQWIVGFVDGEGCFHVSVNKSKDMKIGYQVLPEFVVVQHERDEQVLYALKSYFQCGVVRRNHGDRLCYRVRDKNHLLNIIVPFFNKHQLKTRKRQDFEKFKSITTLMSSNKHLEPEGLDSIRKIAKEMNRGSIKIKSDLARNS